MVTRCLRIFNLLVIIYSSILATDESTDDGKYRAGGRFSILRLLMDVWLSGFNFDHRPRSAEVRAAYGYAKRRGLNFETITHEKAHVGLFA